MIKGIVKRYAFFILALIVTIIITMVSRKIGFKTFEIAGSSFMQMISVLPPIMILLGLMDVWIPRESMMKYMGEDSGVLGVSLSIILGSIAAGPMYAAFPFTAVLLRKGVKFSNIIIFMGAWCVTKVPTFLFELTYLGSRFSFTRLAINFPGIILMGYIVQWMLPKQELEKIYSRAQQTEY